MNGTKKILVKFAAALALALVAYIPTLAWMYDRWVAAESYYGHGFLVPLVSIFIIWQRKDILGKMKIGGDGAGLWIVAVSLFVHIICAALKISFVSGFSFVFAIYGLVLFFFGKEVTRNLTFPIFFLFAMIPLPLVVVGNLTVKLKLFAAQLATFVLNHIGFVCIRDGSYIRMPNSFIEVAAPCSGLRSIISLLTLGLIFAYAQKTSYLKKGILFLSSIPIAIAANVTRIVIVAIVNDLYGAKVAMGAFHDFTGYMVFVLAFFGLLAVAQIMEPGKNADK